MITYSRWVTDTKTEWPTDRRAQHNFQLRVDGCRVRGLSVSKLDNRPASVAVKAQEIYRRPLEAVIK
jgi:hypothetical protein